MLCIGVGLFTKKTPPHPLKKKPNTSHLLKIIAMTRFIKNVNWIIPVIDKHFANSKLKLQIYDTKHPGLFEHDSIALASSSVKVL